MIFMNKQLKGSIALLTATVIWGFAFIAQSVGMGLIGPFTFQMARCLLAVALLVPLSFLLDMGKCSMKESFEKWKNPTTGVSTMYMAVIKPAFPASV